MESKRVIRGNFTTIPTGSEFISTNITNAVTEHFESGGGNSPIPSYDSILYARKFMEENKK